MVDKDFSRCDEIKIYMHCFLSQLVGRSSSSSNSISAASDGHPESWLSNGAVSWQKPERAAGTSGPSRQQLRVNDDSWHGAKWLADASRFSSTTAPPPFLFYENQIFIASFNCSPLPFFTALIVPLEYGLETAHPCPSLGYLF